MPKRKSVWPAIATVAAIVITVWVLLQLQARLGGDEQIDSGAAAGTPALRGAGATATAADDAEESGSSTASSLTLVLIGSWDGGSVGGSAWGCWSVPRSGLAGRDGVPPRVCPALQGSQCQRCAA